MIYATGWNQRNLHLLWQCNMSKVDVLQKPDNSRAFSDSELATRMWILLTMCDEGGVKVKFLVETYIT